MDITALLTKALERGDVAGLLAFTVVLGLGLFLKYRPGDKPAATDNSAIPVSANAKLEKVERQLQTVDARLGRVESDLEHMPTNKDFHDMEVKFERMAGRMISIERTTESTGRAVGRIEDFMLSMKRGKD